MQSNDKLDLTEHVHSERHRAQQLEAQLRNLQTTLELQQAQEPDRDERQPDSTVLSAAAVDDRLQQYALQIQRLEAQVSDWTTRYTSLERQHAQCVMHQKIEARLQQQQQAKQTVSALTQRRNILFEMHDHKPLCYPNAHCHDCMCR